MTSGSLRARPRAVQIGDVHLFLDAGDVNCLVGGIDRLIEGMLRSNGSTEQPGMAEAVQSHIADLEQLRRGFAQPSGTLADPPLQLDPRRARLVRSVLADITGYQRGDLTPGLRDLRQLISR